VSNFEVFVVCSSCKILESAESESLKVYPQGRYSSLGGSSCNTEHVCRAVCSPVSQCGAN